MAAIHASLSPAVNTAARISRFFMLQIGGIVVLFVCVFGGYLMTGGSLGVVIDAAPHEMLTIFGAAIAAMLIAGSMYNMKKIVGALGKVISGPRWKPKDYNDLLCLLFLLTKTMKSKGLIALEAHIEKPDDSSDLQALSQDLQRSFRAGFHLRHAAHDDHEPGRPPPGRNRHGKAAGKAPSRSLVAPMRCNPWPTACRRWASSPPCWA
jgi:hypothetical protein